MADDFSGKQGVDRRQFFQNAAGMAASLVAINEAAPAVAQSDTVILLSSSRAVGLSLRWFLYVTFEDFLLLKGFILTTPLYLVFVLLMLINNLN